MASVGTCEDGSSLGLHHATDRQDAQGTFRAHDVGRLDAGRTALRTLIFPPAFVPDVGLWCLLAGGLWMLLDPEGRVLHDRLLGTAVIRDRVKDVQPQT